MRDLLFILPLLLCIFAMITVLAFTLRAALVHTNRPARPPPRARADAHFVTQPDHAMLHAGREHALGDEATI